MIRLGSKFGSFQVYVGLVAVAGFLVAIGVGLVEMGVGLVAIGGY